MAKVDTPKVKVGRMLVLHGDDWQVRIFRSASQPRHPEHSYWVLFEDAYGDQSMDMVTEKELDERIRAIGEEARAAGESSVTCLGDILRKASEEHCLGGDDLELKDFT